MRDVCVSVYVALMFEYMCVCRHLRRRRRRDFVSRRKSRCATRVRASDAHIVAVAPT